MLGKGWTGSFCRYFRENVLPLAPVLEKAVCEEGPPQEPGAHEEETLNPRAGALRFGPAESPGFQWVLTLFSGQRYPNTFRPGLRGYFVTTGASGQLGPKPEGGMDHSDHTTDETQDHAGTIHSAVHKGLYRLRKEPGQDGRRKIYLCL